MENLDDWILQDHIHYFIPETELIKQLAFRKKDYTLNFNLFSNLIADPIGMKAIREYTGFYIGINILRQDIGFEAGKKPGDFDILIIPFNDSRTFFERTCAIEVKVARPTRDKITKPPNSNGIEQVEGLIRDGFPLVGLIHICMPEPLKEKEKQVIKYDLTPFDMDNPKGNTHFLEHVIDVKLDHFSWFSSINQMKRLLSKNIPKYVGLRTVGVSLLKDQSLVMVFENEFNHQYGSGYFNPHKKQETIDKIESYWQKNKSSFIVSKL